jgi:hypothetical protein
MEEFCRAVQELSGPVSEDKKMELPTIIKISQRVAKYTPS